MDNNGSKALIDLAWHPSFRVMCATHRLVYAAGEPGTGKSFFARHLAREVAGKEPEVLYGSPVTEITELFGRWILAGEETRFCDGHLPLALKEGRWLIVEEFSLIPMELRTSLMRLRGETRITNPLNGENLPVPDNFRMVALSNKESLACRRNSETLRALFSDFMILEVPPLGEKEVKLFLQFHYPQAHEDRVERVVQLWNRFRYVETDGDQGTPKGALSYRAASHLIALLEAGMDEDTAVRVALVNQYITDSDRHSAAQLKQSILD